jgi:DNA polymerase-3 subunit gamma/tau
MSYQVLARKWRPQRFDDVVGQEAVTRTLRNALASGRIAHAFVFAGPRGCGKTTTAAHPGARSTARRGRTPIPVVSATSCIEIAQGRDIDVLEIDRREPHRHRQHPRSGDCRAGHRAGARSLQGVHHRRGAPASTPSFNAPLKSIEEPPAHVVFMMATTELHKIPDTILSRLAGVRVPHYRHQGDRRAARMIAGAGEDRGGRRRASSRAPRRQGMRDAQERASTRCWRFPVRR